MASGAAPAQAPSDEAERAAATAELARLFLAVDTECGAQIDEDEPAGAALLAALPRLLAAGVADVNVRVDHMTPLLLVRGARRGTRTRAQRSPNPRRARAPADAPADAPARYTGGALQHHGDGGQPDGQHGRRDRGGQEAVDVVRTLLRFPGADPNVRIGATSAGLLHAHSALPLAEYTEGATALHMAAQGSLHEAALLEALLAGGADVAARDARGATPLCYAAPYSLHLARCLLDAGACPLAADEDGVCALLQAAANDRTVVALHAPTQRLGTWGMSIVRTDAPRQQSNRGRSAGQWLFPTHEVPMSPLIVARMLPRIATEDGYVEGAAAALAFAADVAEGRHGGAAAVTRMLRLAAAGVPLTWRRGCARAFPRRFKAVVRALLLCRARAPRRRHELRRLRRLWPLRRCAARCHRGAACARGCVAHDALRARRADPVGGGAGGGHGRAGAPRAGGCQRLRFQHAEPQRRLSCDTAHRARKPPPPQRRQLPRQRAAQAAPAMNVDAC
jgi:hypothetical protein